MRRKIAIIFIFTGGVLLVLEIARSHKNYYLQSAGIFFLMTGIYTINTTIKPKIDTEKDSVKEKNNSKKHHEDRR